MRRLIEEVRASVGSVIVGKAKTMELGLVSLLARGHLLIEDKPGSGKTTLAKALASSLGCSFSRIQCTSDLLPSDIAGMTYFDQKAGEFRFRPGPIFANVVLVDEINRATPRTQSSLLEAMEEGQVTIDGVSHKLPQPFIVLATQNPVEVEGTFPLPEAQRDRFLMQLSFGYPEQDEEAQILRRFETGKDACKAVRVLDPQLVAALQEEASEIHVDDGLVRYICDIAAWLRKHPQVELAASPRASLGLLWAAKSLAFVRGRNYVIPDDIKELAVPVLAHRVKLARAERLKGRTARDLIREALGTVRVPVD